MENLTNKLPTEFKAKWVEALRSGKYKQGRMKLYDALNDCYCCLGVADVICGYKPSARGTIDKSHDNVPEPLRLVGSVYMSLIGLNDNANKSFSEIADYIEKEL